MKATIHFIADRQNRAVILEKLKAPSLSVNGKLCIFTVDKGHKNGAEFHVITETVTQMAHKAFPITEMLPSLLSLTTKNGAFTAPFSCTEFSNNDIMEMV